MFGMLGRISVAVFFYMHVVGDMKHITIFMMMQMIVGTLVMPLAPKLCMKYGKRNIGIVSMLIQGLSLIIIFFGPSTNVAFNFVMMIIYGFGYIAGPSGAGMIVDAIDDFDLKYGYRNDGMAFSFSGMATKIGTALANSTFLVIMGLYGYDSMFALKGQLEGATDPGIIASLTEQITHIQFGINMCANLLPGIVFLIGIIPLLIYNLDKPGYMDKVRDGLTDRDASK